MPRQRSFDDYFHAAQSLLEPRVTTASPVTGEHLGMVVATTIVSPINLPPFDCSAMDGFAVRADDIASCQPTVLAAVGRVAAGDDRLQPLRRGTTVKVMTGAPVPPGTDFVIPVENVSPSDGHSTVTVPGAPTGRAPHIRLTGCEVTADEPIVVAGQPLTVLHIALLNATGIDAVALVAPVRVAVISTGTELTRAGHSRMQAQIFESNGPMLAAAIVSAGARVVSVASSPDDPAAFIETLDQATAGADLVITTGGVSRGDFEIVKQTLHNHGVDFVTVAMKPGRPQGMGHYSRCPVLAFPGTPVAALVAFYAFAEPLLRQAMGLPPRIRVALPLENPLISRPGLRQFNLARLTSAGTLHIVERQGLTADHADHLVEIPDDTTHVDAGQLVTAIALTPRILR